MRKFLAFVLLGVNLAHGQSIEELKSAIQKKKDSIAQIEKRVNSLQKDLDSVIKVEKHDSIYQWEKGAFGTLGTSFSGFNNWLAQKIPSNRSSNIGFSFNLYANKKNDKYFLRNSAKINLNWVKIDDRDNPDDIADYQQTNDIFNASSLFGIKYNKTIAGSFFTEFRSTLINNFNNPGYLDSGFGITLTPYKNFVVVIHPINGNFVFQKNDSDFASSLGAKYAVEFSTKWMGIQTKSSFSAFQSYKNRFLSNLNFSSSLNYSLWKTLGIGLDFGFRSNRQEVLNYFKRVLNDEEATLESVGNRVQSYWTFGLSYALSK